MIQTFTEFAKKNLEKQNIIEISAGLVEVAEDSEFSVNSIIGDLIEDENLLNCFISNLKIDGKEFYQVDKSLLDLPIPQIKHILSFADVSLTDLIQKRKEQLQKEEEETRIEEEEDAKKEKRRSEHRFWTDNDIEEVEYGIDGIAPYYDAVVIYTGPHSFLKELAGSLQTHLLSDSPNLPECRKMVQQINEFFK